MFWFFPSITTCRYVPEKVLRASLQVYTSEVVFLGYPFMALFEGAWNPPRI